VRRPHRDLQPLVGDVVRVGDPQGHQVELMTTVDGQVVLELRPLGLAVAETVRVTLPSGAVIDRLGSAGD
jgi:hypothetical protein